jgi:hypothetical protein
VKGDKKLMYNNNLTQQSPYYYGYGVQAPQYQRPMMAQEPPAMAMPNYIKGRPVLSIDEARAS